VITWVRIDRGIAGDPKVHQMADGLTLDVPTVVGHLTLVFAQMAEHARDGNVAVVPDAALEAWAYWRGRRGKFAAAFRTTFAAEGVVTGWDRHNGAAIAKAEKDAARQAAARDRRATDAESHADSPRDVTRTKDGRHADRKRDVRMTSKVDVTNYKENPLPDGKGAPDGASGGANWVATYATDHSELREGEMPHGRLGKALAAVVKRYGADELRPSWRAFLRSDKAQYGPEWFAANLADFRPRAQEPTRSSNGTPMQTPEEIAELNRAELERINRGRAARGEPLVRA
jgi:hypothetical protein